METFEDEERPIEECLVQQIAGDIDGISDDSDDDQIPSPAIYITLSAFVILGIGRVKSKV